MTDQSNRSTQEARRRSLAMAVLLALLAVLILAVTANAYVAKQTRTTLADFDNGTFDYTGLLNIPPDTESVQLLPIGLEGGVWKTTTHLPDQLFDMAVIGHGDYIYIAGGTDENNAQQTGVYSGHLISSTGEIESWELQHPLPMKLSGAAAALHIPAGSQEGTLYVIGGMRGISPKHATGKVYLAPVDLTTGEVGAWITDTHELPYVRYFASAAVRGDYLYVIGGLCSMGTNGCPQGTSYEALKDVEVAHIGAGGALDSAFSPTSALPEPLFRSQVVSFEGASANTMYMIGGRNTLTTTYKVYFADYGAGGTLGPWYRSEGDMPVQLYGHGLVQFAREIILSGGTDDPLSPGGSVSDTIKAALIDPTNPTFRLYDWCFGRKPPECTFGAWQTGGLLPVPREFHGSAISHGWVYVVGGKDAGPHAVDTVWFGSVYNVGSLYAPDGTYVSHEIPLEDDADFMRLKWHTTIGHPGEMELTMQYRYRTLGGDWSPWSAPAVSYSGTNTLPLEPPAQDVRYLQYQAYLSSVVSISSPLLDWVEVYYDLDDPELAVVKNTGVVTGVELGGYLTYAIVYTNTGSWPAENTVITETLPDHTKYAGGPEWQRVGATNQYTLTVGDLDRHSSGSTTFRIQVDDTVPLGVKSITNTVRIGYPPMIDADNKSITDPDLDNNVCQFSNLLLLYDIKVTKDAVPPAGTVVDPGSLITYTIHYQNAGLLPASHTIITDTFDALGGYEIVSISPTVTNPPNRWDLGSLYSGKQGDIQIVTRVKDGVPGNWPITNRAAMKSPEGPAEYSEVLTHTTRVITQSVDLTIESIRLDPPTPERGVPVDFYVTIANRGNKNASTPFWVELYIKRAPSQPPAGPWDHDGGYCVGNCSSPRPSYVDLIEFLDQGSSFDAPFTADDLVFSQGGAYDVYAYIDMAWDAPEYSLFWGLYGEADETNNMAYLRVTLPENPTVYLPIVFKKLRH